jgi:hypothetical protein
MIADLDHGPLSVPVAGASGESEIQLSSFPITNIDKMKKNILRHTTESGAYTIDIDTNLAPYTLPLEHVGADNDETRRYACQYSQEGLALKTYQSDLFNNWTDSEVLDAVASATAVQIVNDEFTIDALNFAHKNYALLSRIAVNGGSYDDWMESVYDHNRAKQITSPVYLGSLIKELAFQEVVSNAEVGNQPLGTLAGKGRLTQKHKGGKMSVMCHEPCMILGLVSLTPRIGYSQGNEWHVNLDSFDDFHKPDFDQLGFQDLILEQLSWSQASFNSDTGVVTQMAGGKQPA